MSKILLTWELGAGLGHVGPLRALGAELENRGHDVTIATVSENITLCQQAFSYTGIEVVEAPKLPPAEQLIDPSSTYAELIYNCGFSSDRNLLESTAQWIELFKSHEPELLIVEHSPSALLASLVVKQLTATIGTGYLIPPDISPLPSLVPHINNELEQSGTEDAVLSNINSVLVSNKTAKLDRVSQLFRFAASEYLTTYEELDHYRPWRSRQNREIKYWKTFGRIPGRRVHWPVDSSNSESHGQSQKRLNIFVYLHSDPPLTPLLRGLTMKKISTICFAPHATLELQQELDRTSVQLSTNPVDIAPIIDRTDIAILNCGHGTICDFLRAGVPLLAVPLNQLEQQITADRISEMGVGITADLNDLNSVALGLETLIEESSYREAALDSSLKRLQTTEADSIREIVDDINKLLGNQGVSQS